MKNKFKLNIKFNYRLIMNFITVCLLIYGIFEMKGFLSENFIENDTELKRKLDRAFRGQQLQDRKIKIQETNTTATNNRDREVIINVKSTK